MTKSQNTKNEQQKDLCITSEQLTEQWKKGELPEERYWVKIKTWCEYITMLYYTSDIFLDGDVPVDNEKIIEVLAPVPSYEEWQGKNNALTSLLAEYGKVSRELQEEKEKHMTRPSLRSPADEMVVEKQVWESTLHRSMVLQAENAQLKELLKDCRLAIYDYPPYDLASDKIRLMQKIDEALR